jgi:hypothetical protein
MRQLLLTGVIFGSAFAVPTVIIDIAFVVSRSIHITDFASVGLFSA